MVDLLGNQPLTGLSGIAGGFTADCIGIRFQVTDAVTATDIGFYRGSTALSAFSDLLFFSGPGTATAFVGTPTDSATVGWQWTALATPINLVPGTTYTVAFNIDPSGSPTMWYWPCASRAAAPAPFILDDACCHVASASPSSYPTTANTSTLPAISVRTAAPGPPGPGEGDPATTGDLNSWLSSDPDVQTHEADGLPWQTKVVADVTKNAVDAGRIVIDATKEIVELIPKREDSEWAAVLKLWQIAGVLTEAEIDLWNLFAKRAPGQLTGPTPGGGSAFFGPSGGQVAERAEVAGFNSELLWHRTQTTNWLDAVPGGDWILADTLEWDGPVAWAQEADCYVFHITAAPTYATAEDVAGTAYWPKAAWWAPMTDTLTHERRYAEFEYAVLHALPMRCSGILLRPRSNFTGTLQAWLRPTPPVP